MAPKSLTTTTAAVNALFSLEARPDHDVILYSSENFPFHVHKKHLTMFSSVFDNQLKLESVVDQYPTPITPLPTDDSEVLRDMLPYFYPYHSDVVPLHKLEGVTLRRLRKALAFANKYKMGDVVFNKILSRMVSTAPKAVGDDALVVFQDTQLPLARVREKCIDEAAVALTRCAKSELDRLPSHVLQALKTHHQPLMAIDVLQPLENTGSCAGMGEKGKCGKHKLDIYNQILQFLATSDDTSALTRSEGLHAFLSKAWKGCDKCKAQLSQRVSCIQYVLGTRRSAKRVHSKQ